MRLHESANGGAGYSYLETCTEQRDYMRTDALNMPKCDAGRISDTPLICVVDDDVSLLRSLRNLLRASGLRVETFESALLFLQSGDRYRADCLVADLQMPVMSGTGLLLALKEAGSRLPVIMLTAHGEEQIRQRCLRAGAAAFLTKPFESRELLDQIELAVAGWRLAAEGS
jgi:FixJ family two-component response regulator